MTTAVASDGVPPRVWKVMIVDDDSDVHLVTKMALGGFEFADRQLQFVSAYSSEEAQQAIGANPDTAVILLDIVMEHGRAGLDFVRYVRGAVANDDVRIVLRTGQPGQAPEQQVVRDYDINDYREKTDLTAPKLNTLMYSTLRSFRDITRLKAQREELRQAETEARAANEAKSLFLANISHEFRTPLNGIIGLAAMMGEEILGPLGNRKYREYCQDIKASGEGLLAKIDSVLEIAEHGGAPRPLQEEQVDLAALIAECLRSAEAGWSTPGGWQLSGGRSGLLLHADRQAVRRMLTNLLSNALKYNTSVGTVRVTARRLPGGDLAISVIDNGPGIEPEVLRRIGEPFTVEGESYLWSKRGIGLGLAIARRLIEQHGGRLELDSTVGQGTAARLVFPAARVVRATGGDAE